MADAWTAGDRKGAAALVPGQVVDDLLVHGSAEQCQERVAEYRASGIDTPVISIIPGTRHQRDGGGRRLGPA